MERTYITNDAIEALHNLAIMRDETKLREESDRIYKALKADLQDVMDSKDDVRIMRVVDRKIGKTYSLIRLACEYNIPIVPHKNLERMYRDMAREEFGKAINVITIRKGGYAKGRYDIVLKDEGVSTQEVIDYFSPYKTKIIGVSSLFERW